MHLLFRDRYDNFYFSIKEIKDNTFEYNTIFMIPQCECKERMYADCTINYNLSLCFSNDCCEKLPIFSL